MRQSISCEQSSQVHGEKDGLIFMSKSSILQWISFVHKDFFFKIYIYKFHILLPKLIRAKGSKIQRLRRLYIEKATIIDNDKKAQLIYFKK